MHESVALCKQSMYSQSTEVANAARLLIGQANRVVQSAVRLVNKHGRSHIQEWSDGVHKAIKERYSEFLLIFEQYKICSVFVFRSF